MTPFRLLCMVAIASAAVALAVCAWDEITIDRCLDNGGRWNSEKSACEGAPR